MEPLTILLVALILTGLALWWVPKWQVRRVQTLEDRIALEIEARKTLAQILGGVFFLATLYFTWANLKVAERSQTLEYQVSQESQITERFTRAIEQLGSRQLELRLGGIYALERITKDSPKDHWTIMEVLTAYVRANARWNDGSQKEKPQTKRADPASRDRNIRPPVDIQAILTVLGRRETIFEKEDQYLDLRWVDIRGADLFEANLARADLTGAIIRGGYLRRVNLAGADLVEADLAEAILWEANFEEANLGGATLERSDLTQANLARSHLGGANMTKATLIRTNLKGADLVGSLWSPLIKDKEGKKPVVRVASPVTGLTRQQIGMAIIDENTLLPDYLKDSGQTEPSTQ